MSNDNDNHDDDPIVICNGVEMKESRKNKIIAANLKHIDAHQKRCYINYCIYFLFIIIMGIPMWWITTSPYRASLQRVDLSKIKFPVEIQVFTLTDDNVDINEIMNEIKNNNLLNIPYEPEREFNIDFGITYIHKKVDQNELIKMANQINISKDKKISTCNIIIIPDELFYKLSSKSACSTYVTKSGALLIHSSTKIIDIIHHVQEFINYQWMDIPKIINFMNRASQADTEHVTSDVWNEVPISGAYNIHLMFVHDSIDDIKWSIAVEDKIRNEIKKLTGYLSDTAHFEVTEEHFWDLLDMNIFEKAKNDNDDFSYSGKSLDFNNLITEIDQLSSQFTSPHPLLKFVFLLTKKGIKSDDEKTKGLTYLSWGTLINSNPNNYKQQRDSIHESFQTLLGTSEGSTSDVKFCYSRELPSTFVWDRFRRRAFFENSIRSKIYINAVNSLASSIQQLVITEEVGQMIKKSNELLIEGINEQNTQKIAATRLIAEKSAKHETLLGMFDLTTYFKFGLYVPIVMPFVHPLIEVVFSSIYCKIKDKIGYKKKEKTA